MKFRGYDSCHNKLTLISRLTYERLREAGIHLMVCPALEEDQGEGGRYCIAAVLINSLFIVNI